MTSKILITTPGYPWNNHPYSTQGYYLLKMFAELDYDITYISFGEKSLAQNLRTFSQVANMENSDDINLINSYINKDNLELFHKAKYSGIKYGDNKEGIYVSHYNQIIDENDINYIFVLGDLSNFIGDEYFRCKSVIWFPNSYEPLDKKNKSKLQLFDKILCLNPSSINIIRAYFNENIPISYAPHIIDYDHVSYLQSLITTQSRDDLKNKYKIPTGSQVISIIGGNYEKNIRKGFDTSFQIFGNIVQKYNNVFLYVQATTYQISNFDNDLEQIIDYLDIPKDKYLINTKPVSSVELEEIYKMTDVLLMGSKTEGFGLPLIEAQIRGIPIVSNKFTAMRDYTFYGISCDPAQLYYDGYGGGMMSMPSVQNMTNGVCYVLDNLITKKFQDKKVEVIERIKIQMSYETIKSQIEGELNSITDPGKYTYCFILDEDCEITRNNIKNIKKSCYVITSENWAEIYSIRYQYLVLLHYQCQINPLFFNLLNNLQTGVVLKTQYKNGVIYPNSIEDIIQKNRRNNIVAPKQDVNAFVKCGINKSSSQYLDNDVLNFTDFYYELVDKYIESKKLSTTEHIVIDVL